MEKLKFNTVGQFLVALEESPLYNQEGYMVALVNGSEVVVEHAEKTVSHFCMRPLLDVIKKEEFTRQKPIPDKALVWCWDDNMKCRDIRFYDKISECHFDIWGRRSNMCTQFEHYEAIPKNPETNLYDGAFSWANEAVKKLED